jgi:hypothetical protein
LIESPSEEEEEEEEEESEREYELAEHGNKFWPGSSLDFLKGPKYKKKISGWSLRHAPTEDIPPCPAMNGLFPGYPKIRGFGPDSRK